MGEEDTVRIRAGRLWSGKAAVTADEAAELRQLYDELPDASTGAAEALGGAGVPTGMTLQRFLEFNGRVVEIVDRIKEILG
jgi:hypothetical protein